MPKRGRDTTDLPTSSAASGQSSQNVRKRKRTRVEDQKSIIFDNLPEGLPAKPVQAVAELRIHKAKENIRTKIPLLVPTKRPVIAGRLKRLAVPKPVSLAVRSNSSGSTNPNVNRRGNKINKGWGTGGFDGAKDVSAVEHARETDEDMSKENDRTNQKASKNNSDGPELWITRKTSYPAYLRSGVAAFMEKGFADSYSGQISRSEFDLQQSHFDTTSPWGCYPGLSKSGNGHSRCTALRRQGY